VPLSVGKHHLVYVFAETIPVPYVIANSRTPAKVEQAVTAQLTVHHEVTYVVPSTIDNDGLSLTP
jgi:hypothetical protein